MNAEPQPVFLLTYMALFSVGALVAIVWICLRWARSPRRLAVPERPILSVFEIVVWLGLAAGLLGFALPRVNHVLYQESARTHDVSDLLEELERRAPEAELTAEAVPVSEIKAAAPDLTLPAWTRQPVTRSGEATLVVLGSKQYATPEQAEQEILPDAEQLVRAHFHQVHAHLGNWRLPADVLKSAAVQERHVQEVERDFGRFTGKMYRVYLQLKLAPEVREKVYPTWRAQIVERRLGVLGGIAGLLTLMTAAAAGYFRVDTLTGGVYRGKLKLAAAAVAALGGVAFTLLLG